MGGNTKEEKTEVLNVFFSSDFNSKTSCPGTQPYQLDNRDGEKNEAPIAQREMVSDTQNHRDVWGQMGSTNGY